MTGSVIQKKVSLLGDFSTGKTSLVRRFVYNLFDERYMSTLGVNISRKVIEIPLVGQVRLLIWDLSGNEKYDGARLDYLRGTSGAFLVCDLTRPDTVERMNFYREYLYQVSPGAPIVLIGNKVDLVTADAEACTQVAALGAKLEVPYRITSAKTGEGVESAFLFLAGSMVPSDGS